MKDLENGKNFEDGTDDINRVKKVSIVIHV